ncbi:MAG: 50S ribosomal protein L6 [Calditrichaeota bacterium]|nr:MAG: 50S ribosomal protein L6 [Calditrichota bacterium]
MSRIGKLPIPIPAGVALNIEKNTVTAKGPKGVLSVQVHPELTLNLADNNLQVQRPNDAQNFRAMHGLYRTLISNIIEGVSKGFQRRLEITGVGYRAELKGKNLLLTLGYSHEILVKPPEGVEITTEGNNAIMIRGIDKALVGQIAAKIRSLRPPEPYKGKGIRYAGEVIRRKAGKSAGK